MEISEAQRTVIENLDSDILLLASAGTGKTFSLAMRIANILSKKRAEQSEILCLTFTNKASKEMRERIEEIVTDGDAIEIRTIHGFCYQILKCEAKKTDIPRTFTVFDEEDQDEILLKIFPKNCPKNALRNFITLVKEEGALANFFTDNKELDIKKTLAFLYKNKKEKIHHALMENFREVVGLFELLQREGENIIKNYQRELLRNHALDYTDLIMHTYLLLANAEILEAWAKKYRFIHIDEVQDTNLLEYKLLRKLFQYSTILLAGDYWQTIYEWRGSNPDEVIARYREERHPLILHFTENYRSTRTLLAASMGFLKRAFPKKENFLSYETLPKIETQGVPIKLKQNFSLREEAEWIYRQILFLAEKDPLIYAKTAILTRTNNVGKEISNSLLNLHLQLGAKNNSEKREFPFSLVDEYQFFRRQEIKDILAYLKILLNPEDKVSLRRILKRLSIGVGEKTIEKIESEEFLHLGIQITDYLEKNALVEGDFYAPLVEAFQSERVVVFDVESTGVDIEKDEIIQLSAILLDKNGKEKEIFNRYVKTNRPLGTSVDVHHITEEILEAKGEEAAKVFRDFEKFIENKILVGHNISYDLSILASQRERLKMTSLSYLGYADTLSIFRRFYPNLENYKLSTLCELFQTDNLSSHNALDDVRATGDILSIAIKEKILPRAKERKVLFQKYSERFLPIANFMEELKKIVHARGNNMPTLLVKLIKEGGINSFYQKEDAKNGNTKHRENLIRLYHYTQDVADEYINTRAFMREIVKMGALSASEIDILTKKHPKIPIITVHQAKGMEFDYVFLPHLEENVFPSYASIKDGNLDEEKRVFYVAMTRAKKALFLSYHRERPYSDRSYQKSEFLELVPEICVEEV